MNAFECLIRAREALKSGRVTPIIGVGVAALEAVSWAAEGDPALVVEMLDVLDAVVPPPFTFSMWADGAEVCGDEFAYNYDRTVSEVVELMRRACMKGVRRRRAQMVAS